MVKVNVIIPIHNREQFLERTLNSCLKLSHNNCDIECVLVDDDSTDLSSEIAKSYETKHPELFTYLKIHHRGHYGPWHARNVGIRYSDGKYLKFLDADDELEPHTIDRQVEYMESHPLVDLYGESTYFVAMDWYGCAAFKDINNQHFGMYLYRKELVEKLPLFQDIPGEDVCFVMNYMYHFPIVVMELKKTSYIYHDENRDVSCNFAKNFNLPDGMKYVHASYIQRLNEMNDDKYPLYVEFDDGEPKIKHR